MCEKIWLFAKKVVPLHSISEEMPSAVGCWGF